MVAMISDQVVEMLNEFCVMARGAVSDYDGREDEMMMEVVRSGLVSESMAHNLNIAGVMVGTSLYFSLYLYFSLPSRDIAASRCFQRSRRRSTRSSNLQSSTPSAGH